MTRRVRYGVLVPISKCSALGVQYCFGCTLAESLQWVSLGDGRGFHADGAEHNYEGRGADSPTAG